MGTVRTGSGPRRLAPRALSLPLSPLFAAFLVLIAVGALGLFAAPANAQSAEPYVAVVTLDGAIDPISAGFLSRALETAADRQAELVVIFLDTPGGLLASTREMVEAILASEVPVAVYVWPPGAQAASAGTFILAAGHIAAMAPSTNVGAASPVGPSGEDLPDTLASKAKQDAAAFLRSIADERGRNGEALQATVLDATSYTAREAVELGVVDLIATDLGDLFTRIDGMSVEVRGASRILRVEGLGTEAIERTLVERFLGAVADPNIALLLISIGSIGILIEFLNPGGIFPGLFGLLALVLAFVALGNLPVNWTGFGLIMLAMVLFFIEIQAPGMSVPGIAGGVAFVLGAFLLFGGFSPPPLEGPSFRVSIWALVGVGVGMAAMMGMLVRTSRTAKGAADRYEITTVLGAAAISVTPLDPDGTVRAQGEEWSAVSEAGDRIEAGESLVVTATEGLTVRVKRADPETNDAK